MKVYSIQEEIQWAPLLWEPQEIPYGLSPMRQLVHYYTHTERNYGASTFIRPTLPPKVRILYYTRGDSFVIYNKLPVFVVRNISPCLWTRDYVRYSSSFRTCSRWETEWPPNLRINFALLVPTFSKLSLLYPSQFHSIFSLTRAWCTVTKGRTSECSTEIRNSIRIQKFWLFQSRIKNGSSLSAHTKS